jgi:biotin carboxylase
MMGTKAGNILVLGASVWQIPIIEQIQRLGYSVVATDRNPEAIGFDIAEYSEPVDIADAEGTLDAARRYNVIAAVSDQTDLAIPTLAYVCDKMGLIGPSPHTALNTTNKRVMRELTQDHLPTPKWFATDDRRECIAKTKEIGLPVVIKPTDSQASRGVRKVTREDEVGPAFDNALPFSREGMVLIEEFMIGREATADGFHDNERPHLLGVSLKRHTPPPCIIAINIDFPAPLPDRFREKIEWTYYKIIELLGIERGNIHGELILTKEGPMLVEMANRGGGSGIISHLIPAISGVNCLEAYIRQAVGEEVKVMRKWHKGGVMRFKVYGEGKVKDIVGLEEARAIPGVVFIILYIKPGDVLTPIVMDTQRHALIITEGDDLAAARRVVNDVEKAIKIVYE